MKTVATLLIGICLLAGCATKGIPVTTTRTSDAPPWIDNEIFSAEQISAVGIAQKNPLDDKSMQRTEALVDARTKMAQKITAHPQSVFKQFNRHQTDGGKTPAGKAAASSDVMSRTAEETRRQVVGLVLHGTAPEKFWTDPADGTLYVLVVMNGENSARAFSIADSLVKRKDLDQRSRNLQEEMLRMDETLKSQGE